MCWIKFYPLKVGLATIDWEKFDRERSNVDEYQLTLSVPEAGRRLGLGKNLSYEAAQRGELPVLRFGRRLRVPVAALERLLNSATVRAGNETN